MTYEEVINEHGGYWNYHKLLDYYYLVNTYFPTKRMIRDFNNMSKSLITNYPSCQKAVSELASNIYNVTENNIVVGNGASEIIRFICKKFNGITGIIYPSFNEYRESIENFIEFNSTNYSAEDIIKFFNNKVNNIVIVNPQLHTGKYLNSCEMDKIVSWCKCNKITLVVDESFIDFSDYTFAFDLSRIYDYENLFIIKSLSKSFGVPGIRIGVLASSNIEIVADMKKELPIWNISSFAQYFLEILIKYKKDFIKSLKKLKMERERFIKDLSKISEFVVEESSANYFKVNLKSMDSDEFCGMMLDHGVILRNLKDKFGTNSIRVSIRSKKDNKRFIRVANTIIDKKV